MKYTTYLKITIFGTLLMLIAFASVTVYVDPLFHYHAPLESMQYPLYDERYMNDGIVRHFEYDAVITGSSMTENFKTSLFDNAFGTHSVKVPFSGGTYKEVNDSLKRAFEHNDSIEVIMRGLDMSMLLEDKDALDYEDYPYYLYDDNLLNDVNYVLNKEILFTFTDYVFTFMRLGGKNTPFDAYKNWNGNYEYNGNRLKEEYMRAEPAESEAVLTPQEVVTLTENVEQNVLALVREHPETEFYFFVPPYSILYWDDCHQRKEVDKMLDAHEKMIELLLPYENVHLYSFFDNTEMICNLNLYRDSYHYNQEVSDKIIESMLYEEGLLTTQNYRGYMETVRTYYTQFDYDGFFENQGVP